MESTQINGLRLVYHLHDSEAVPPVRQACQRSIELIRASWGLEAPQDCRVYLMTSLLGFTFDSAPWPWKVLLALSLPLWYPRQARLWSAAGGYAQRYGRRYVVGVKPPHLIQTGSRALGDKIFIRENDPIMKIQSITCHELTHAFSAHLQLPPWLKEGLAMVTVDRFFEKPTVLPETLGALARLPRQEDFEGSQAARIGSEDALIQQYIFGYWVTRYLESTRPGMLKELLARGLPSRQIEGEIAAVYDLDQSDLQGKLSALIISHFSQD